MAVRHPLRAGLATSTQTFGAAMTIAELIAAYRAAVERRDEATKKGGWTCLKKVKRR